MKKKLMNKRNKKNLQKNFKIYLENKINFSLKYLLLKMEKIRYNFITINNWKNI
jgi:hypothetical protein